jgi:NAD(P)-dependent dehydrogenase (short-subunit alcohol dehydrogenase family)
LVVAIDISAERLDDLKSSLSEAKVVTVTGDITRQDDIDAIAAAAGETIDALANVAGINDDFSPLHETTDAMYLTQSLLSGLAEDECLPGVSPPPAQLSR